MSVAPEPLGPGDATAVVERFDIVSPTSMQSTIKLAAEKYMPIDDAEVEDGEPPVPTHGAKSVTAAATCHGRNASLIPGECVGECGRRISTIYMDPRARGRRCMYAYSFEFGAISRLSGPALRPWSRWP